FLRPRSRGRIALRDADPRSPVRIHANYLSDPEGFDLAVMVECARLSRQLLSQPAFARYLCEPIHPSRTDPPDAERARSVRAKAETIYAPAGCCRLGKDAAAVVDPQLRVRGIDGLRVVVAWVMPELPGGNTYAPVLMIAGRTADLLRGRAA